MFTYIYLLINQSVSQSSINQSMNRCINQSIRQSVSQSVSQSTNQPTDEWIKERINQSINQSIFYLEMQVIRGESSGRMQGMCTTPLPPTWDVKTSSLCSLLFIFLPHQSVTPFLRGTPPPKKNPGSYLVMVHTVITILGSQTLLWTCAE